MSGYLKNSKGAACRLHGIAYKVVGNNGIVYYADIYGPAVAVRALLATIHKSQNMRVASNYQVRSWRKLSAYDGHFLTMSTRMLDNTEMRTIAVLEPKVGEGTGVICNVFGDSEQQQLYRILDLYTPYAVLADWSEQLLMAGKRHRLVTGLNVSGLDWASVVELEGWDDVIDELAKSGELAHL